jgi:hypothetical protein
MLCPSRCSRQTWFETSDINSSRAQMPISETATDRHVSLVWNQAGETNSIRFPKGSET